MNNNLTADSVPKHIAIIMDGNRRWAKNHGLPLLEGHRQGAEQFKKIAVACKNLGVKILTVYAFSTENWKRTKEEVAYMMDLLESILKREKGFFKKENIKMNIIGRVEDLPEKVQKAVREIMERTKDNTAGVFNLALSYGGRAEIVDAVKKIIKEKIEPEKINEETFEKYLYTAGQPDPDLLIRTSGEMRTSGFLTWQSVYSELYFSSKLWPEFSEEDLKTAIAEYQNRQRRFGK